VKRALLILAGVFLGGTVALPQTKTNDPHAQALKVLHQAVDEFNKDPNAAGQARSNIAASSKAAAAAKSAPVGAPTPAMAPETALATVPDQPERSFAEMEQMYLDGKISAKQFQKYLQERKIRPAKTGVETAQPGGLTATPTNAAPGAMSDVEKKLDDLERAKAARESAETNRAASATAPKTKRERLDDLLRQLIEGKVSEEEYKARREKIIAEPN
jgi:hypothetical protein